MNVNPLSRYGVGSEEFASVNDVCGVAQCLLFGWSAVGGLLQDLDITMTKVSQQSYIPACVYLSSLQEL